MDTIAKLHNGQNSSILNETTEIFSNNPKNSDQTQSGNNEVPKKIKSSKKYSCPYCDKEFTRTDNLERHLENGCRKSLKEGSKTMACPKCNKEFSRSDSLKRHQRKDCMKSHKCPKCAKTFKHPNNLEKHFNRHESHRSHGM